MAGHHEEFSAKVAKVQIDEKKATVTLELADADFPHVTGVARMTGKWVAVTLDDGQQELDLR